MERGEREEESPWWKGEIKETRKKMKSDGSGNEVRREGRDI